MLTTIFRACKKSTCYQQYPVLVQGNRVCKHFGSFFLFELDPYFDWKQHDDEIKPIGEES